MRAGRQRQTDMLITVDNGYAEGGVIITYHILRIGRQAL